MHTDMQEEFEVPGRMEAGYLNGRTVQSRTVCSMNMVFRGLVQHRKRMIQDGAILIAFVLCRFLCCFYAAQHIWQLYLVFPIAQYEPSTAHLLQDCAAEYYTRLHCTVQCTVQYANMLAYSHIRSISCWFAWACTYVFSPSLSPLHPVLRVRRIALSILYCTGIPVEIVLLQPLSLSLWHQEYPLPPLSRSPYSIPMFS